MYKITIIIPVYNVEQYIVDCLSSVARQTYKGPIECLIVDDCGNDSSISLAESFIDEYTGPIQFRIIHHESNKGLSGARNTGMKKSSGDYIYFLDSDDEILDDCIEKLVSPLNTRIYDFVIGNIKVIGKENDTPKLKLTEGAVQSNDEIAMSRLNGNWYQMAWNKLYNKEFLNKNNLSFCEGIIHEDELWSAEIACVAKSMYVVDDTTYIYKIREASIMTSLKYKKRIESYGRIFEELSDFIVENNLKENTLPRFLIYNLFDRFLGLIYNEYRELFNESYRKFRETILSRKIYPISTSLKAHIKNSHFKLNIRLGAFFMRCLLDK